MPLKSSAETEGTNDDIDEGAAADGRVAIALASGCGDDNGAKPLSKSQFIAQAGTICARNKAKADRVFQHQFRDLGRRKPTLAESQRMLATMLPIIRDSGAAIARLAPPVGDEERSPTSPPTSAPPSRCSGSRATRSRRAR